MKANDGLDIVYRPDGTQVVKRVPDGYYLVHIPSGFYFLPGTRPGWNGVLLDQDWALVPIQNVNIFGGQKPVMYAQQDDAGNRLKLKKQVQFTVFDDIQKVEDFIRQKFYRYLLKGDVQPGKLRDAYEKFISQFEKLLETFEDTENDINEAIKEIRNPKKQTEFIDNYQKVKAIAKEFKEFLQAKVIKKTSASLKDLLVANEKLQSIFGFLTSLFSVNDKQKVSFSRLYNELLKSVFGMRMISLMNDLLSLSEYVENNKLSSQDMEIYGNFVNLVLTQIDNSVAVLSSPIFVTSIYGDHELDEIIRGNLLGSPSDLLRLVFDTFNAEEINRLKDQEIEEIDTQDNLIKITFKSGTELYVELPGKAKKLYNPKSTLTPYRGRNILAPSALRIYDTEKAAGFVNLDVNITIKDKTSIERTASLALKLSPITYTFVRSGFYALYSASVKETRSAIDKAKARLEKLKEMYSLTDIKDLLHKLSSTLFRKTTNQEELFLSLELLDYLVLLERNKDAFLENDSQSNLKAKELIKKLFGVYYLYSDEDKKRLDGSRIEIGDNIYYPYTYVLSSSLKNLSALDYVYARNENGEYLDFTLKTSKEFIDNASVDYGVLESIIAPNEAFFAKMLDFLIEVIDFLDSNRSISSPDLSKTMSAMFLSFFRDEPKFSLADQKIKNVIIGSFVSEAIDISEELRHASKYTYFGEAFERLFVAMLRSLILLNTHGSAKTKKEKIGTIPIQRVDLDDKSSILFLMDEQGGVGDVRILIVNKEKNEVLPIIYELKARSKVIIPQMHSVLDLYDSLKTVLTSFYGKKHFVIYSPRLYAFGVKKHKKDTIEGATPYIMNLNEDSLNVTAPLEPKVETKFASRKVKHQDYFIDREIPYFVIKKSHALVYPYSYMVTSISLPEGDIEW